jgi:hypothetical protein
MNFWRNYDNKAPNDPSIIERFQRTAPTQYECKEHCKGINVRWGLSYENAVAMLNLLWDYYVMIDRLVQDSSLLLPNSDLAKTLLAFDLPPIPSLKKQHQEIHDSLVNLVLSLEAKI